MSALDELIQKITDADLRNQIRAEVRRLKRDKKFGLVFEEHKESFGEIYPSLQRLDEVCNAPDSELWHVLIEAENYHALQLLKYVCADRKVDCIYIDPPYNTGARDWKYNNDYVDGTDAYRHSKWLSMMKRRLELAKEILNPADSVLIVTIDEHEYLHLGCLLEEIFPEAHIQMVSIVINPNGVARDHEMYRVEEYAFFVYLGQSGPAMLEDPLFTSEVGYKKLTDGEVAESNHSRRTPVRWERLLRGGLDSDRERSPGCFYPVYIDPIKKKIVDVGEALNRSQLRSELFDREGLVTVWPIAEGTQDEKRWQMTAAGLRKLVEDGFAKVGAYNKNLDRWSLLYLGKKQRERINSGQIKIVGRDDNGVVIVEESGEQSIKRFPKTVWNRQSHSAGEYGSRLLRRILPGRFFPFPKSLYAVRDTLKSVLADKPEALIVDFFAGSGTTAHAVNLLNAEDGGRRRCIMITNNEVSDAEEKQLRADGLQPDDAHWQALGIARYVTWPRTVCSIKGHDINGAPLKGNYLGSELPMSDGFRSNAIFFKLGFLDKNAVALGRRFKEILPLMWLKAGGHGRCPTVDADQKLPPLMILIENKFAVLFDEKYFMEFERQILDQPTIETIFIVTDSTDGYVSMIQNFRDRKTYQLYRDYLENFIG